MPDSLLQANAAGVIARHQDPRLPTVEVYGNRITDNDVRDGLPAVTDVERRLATGAGVWLDGAADSLVTGNVIAGNTFGVAVSGGAHGVTVTDSDVRSNGTDLAWDGIGVTTCFAGHAGHATSDPPAIQASTPATGPPSAWPTRW